MPCASLIWKGLSASELILPTNPASGREHGSNSAPIGSRSSSLAVTFPERAASMRYSSGVYEKKDLKFVAKVKKWVCSANSG